MKTRAPQLHLEYRFYRTLGNARKLTNPRTYAYNVLDTCIICPMPIYGCIYMYIGVYNVHVHVHVHIHVHMAHVHVHWKVQRGRL